jgi:membrane protein DedA with SNARE-associated domain/membrane-associated phospholipid phosphatase
VDAAWVQHLLQWAQANPALAYALVFAFAFSESIFMLGLIVPGALLLFGVGAMIPTGALQLAPTLLWAIIGAVLGDCLSYWLGRYYRERLYRMWPLSRYPGVARRGQDYFSRHGGKSVLLGRFVGAVRPIIPTVAGVAGMRPLHFVLVDVLSAVAWAPCYILPGALVGASLGLVAEVALRLVVVVLATGLLLWLVLWLTRLVLAWLPAHAEELVHGLLDWSRRHRLLGRLGRGLADPTQPETPALAMLALLLLAAGWLSLYLMWGLGAPRYPVPTDAMVYQLFQDLRTPGMDRVAMALAQLGDWEVYLPLSLAVLAALLVTGRSRAAAHWLGGLSFGALLAAALSGLLAVPQPIEYYRNEVHAGFAGGHSVFAAVVYGFLPVLLSSRLRVEKRWRYYVPFLSLVVLIALARLYLGAQWLSDTLLGLTLGLAWVGLLTLGYRRHRPQLVPAGSLVVVAMVAITAGAAYQWGTRHHTDLEHYARRMPQGTMTVAEWQAEGHARLPAYRVDLRGRRGDPLNLQWAGRLTDIEAQLTALGWQATPEFTALASLRWLSKHPDIAQLPVLPQVHDGQHQALMLRHPADADRQWVLRLWPSAWQLAPDGTEGRPLWVGSVSRQRLQSLFNLASAPLTERDFDAPLALLEAQLAGRAPLVVRQAQDYRPDAVTRWDGRVLLLDTPPAAAD